MSDSPVLTRDFFVTALHTDINIGGSKAHLRAVLDGFLADLAAALRQGHTVQFKGLGRFSVVDTPERPGRNPRTGAPTVIPAGRRIKFKPSPALRGDAREEEPT